MNKYEAILCPVQFTIGGHIVFDLDEYFTTKSWRECVSPASNAFQVGDTPFPIFDCEMGSLTNINVRTYLNELIETVAIVTQMFLLTLPFSIRKTVSFNGTVSLVLVVCVCEQLKTCVHVSLPDPEWEFFIKISHSNYDPLSDFDVLDTK